MRVITTSIPELLILEPKVFGDERGFLFESYNEHVLQEAGVDAHFVQDNYSRSGRNVLRGLHYQIRHAQGKLLRAVVGRIFDVAVDLRRDSPSFGKWEAVELSAENKRMIWIPPGFAHGFFVLSETAEVLYKASEYYTPESERSILWSDPQIGIKWPVIGDPILSKRDAAGVAFADAEVYEDDPFQTQQFGAFEAKRL